MEYLTTQAEREPYEITINGTGLGSSDADGTAGEKLWRMTQTGEPVNTGSKGWIFVLLNGRLYACEKRTNTFPRFHHSSFFAGASVSAAGMLVCVNGKLTKLFPHSGHYRPLDRHLYSLLAFLRDKGVDLSAVQVDVQRVMKLSRAQDKGAYLRNFFNVSTLFCGCESLISLSLCFFRWRQSEKDRQCILFRRGNSLPLSQVSRLLLISPFAALKCLAMLSIYLLVLSIMFHRSKTGFQECGALRHINKRRLDYTEGEESAPVKAKTAHVLTVSSPTIAADGPIESRTPLSPVETEDALGQLPVLHKTDSGDGPPHSPSERSSKLRLSIAPSSASNRSSLNMNRLSLSSTGGYASTVGSTSPFCSPIAQHNLYPLHGSSSGGGSGGGGEGRREGESVDNAGGHRLTSTSNDSAGGGFDPSRTNNDSFSQSHSDKNNSNNNNNINNNSDYAYNTSSKGLFGSTSGDEYSSIEALLGNITQNTHKQQHQEQQRHQQQPQPQEVFGSGGRSSADARARLLNTMLYADPAGAVSNPTGLVGSTTTMGRSKESSTSLLLPPSPPVPVPTSAVRTVSSSNNNNNNGSAVYVQTTVATPALKIPVAAPIKKVTSYSSISSSYGSSSFAQPQPFYGNRSRSTSKAEHDLDYDLRMLLGESPIVQAPDVNYFNYDVSAASPVNTLTGNGYSQYNINTNSNSTCNSRGRSRGSSYNPPYIPSATNNSSSNALASVGYNLHNSVSNNSIAGSGSGSGHNTRSNSLYGGTTGTNGNSGNGNTGYAVKDPSGSEQHSPAVDKYSPRSSIGSIGAGVAAAGGNTALSDSIKANTNINSAEKKVDPSIGAWSPPSGTGGIGMNAGEGEEKSSSRSRSASARLFSEDVSIPAGASIASVPVYGSGKSNHFPPATPSSGKLAAGGPEGMEGLSPPAAGEVGLYAGSPQPSFASSLSSTDSLPNMMLNYVMSPGGTTLHRYFDGQGEGDGMYEAEVLGDSYHDHLYGDNENEA